MTGLKVAEVNVHVQGVKTERDNYQEEAETEKTPAKLTFVPYYAWGNRGRGEMCVWVRE